MTHVAPWVILTGTDRRHLASVFSFKGYSLRVPDRRLQYFAYVAPSGHANYKQNQKPIICILPCGVSRVSLFVVPKVNKDFQWHM